MSRLCNDPLSFLEAKELRQFSHSHELIAHKEKYKITPNTETKYCFIAVHNPKHR